MDFYSARLLYVVLVDDRRPRRRNLYNESVVVFRARDFDHALKRALALGRAAEHHYDNHRGQTVRWALVEVLNLDHVGRRVDGGEVASALRTRVASKPLAFGTHFHPEHSRPKESF